MAKAGAFWVLYSIPINLCKGAGNGSFPKNQAGPFTGPGEALYQGCHPAMGGYGDKMPS